MLKIINSQENPDYKIPWLLFVLVVPVAGFMIYLMFYDRRLLKKYVKRIEKISNQQIKTKDKPTLEKLKKAEQFIFLEYFIIEEGVFGMVFL